MTDAQFKAFVINLLRRGTFRWKCRNEAKKGARVPNGEYKNGNTKYGYKCKKCKEIFKSSEVQMDHLYPVIDPISGFVDWDSYIRRMFCNKENFVVLCKSCHDEKTKKEVNIRTEARKIENNNGLRKLKENYETWLLQYKN